MFGGVNLDCRTFIFTCFIALIYVGFLNCTSFIIVTLFCICYAPFGRFIVLGWEAVVAPKAAVPDLLAWWLRPERSRLEKLARILYAVVKNVGFN